MTQAARSTLHAIAGTAVLSSAVLLWGCHSAAIDATVHNGTPSELRLVEVDYPSASFGTQSLAPGSDFAYRLKLLGSGPLKLIYTDSTGKERTVAGPELNEGSEGRLRIEISPDGVHWEPKLTSSR